MNCAAQLLASPILTPWVNKIGMTSIILSVLKYTMLFTSVWSGVIAVCKCCSVIICVLALDFERNV